MDLDTGPLIVLAKEILMQKIVSSCFNLDVKTQPGLHGAPEWKCHVFQRLLFSVTIQYGS